MVTPRDADPPPSKSVIIAHDIDARILTDAEVRLKRCGALDCVDVRIVCSSSSTTASSILGGRGGDVAKFSGVAASEADDLSLARVDRAAIANALGSDGLADVVLVDAPCSS